MPAQKARDGSGDFLLSLRRQLHILVRLLQFLIRKLTFGRNRLSYAEHEDDGKCGPTATRRPMAAIPRLPAASNMFAINPANPAPGPAALICSLSTDHTHPMTLAGSFRSPL
jgi:hypothetical protein